ncbi:MAG: thiamine phosphate synthase [Candidatus Dormiibacterota bacterium]
MSQAWVGTARFAAGSSRRAQLRHARLYLVTDDNTRDSDLPGLIAGAVAGGVDVVQLRRKQSPPDELRELAVRCLESAHEGGALFLLDDHVDLAREVGADGVHIGQADLPPASARSRLGAELLLGLSTHSKQDVLRAASQPVDYISAGPVHLTPTKPGRPAVGFEHISVAAARSSVPVVAIGGLGVESAGKAMAAGADVVAVVRAICLADDPGEAASELRAAIEAAPIWISLRVNGQQRKAPPGISIEAYLQLLELPLDGVAVERNGEILRTPELAAAPLQSGDELEVVHLVGGGDD